MTIRNRMLSGIIGMLVSFIAVLILIVMWPTLSELVGGMNVGILILFEQNFWVFVVFFFGITFVLGLLFNLTIKARWGSRPT